MTLCPRRTRITRSMRSTATGADLMRPLLNLTNPSIRVNGALWCEMVYSGAMSTAEKLVRQSVSLPARVASRVKSLARNSGTSANRVIVELIETGLEARAQEKKRFFDLADRLARSRDREEQKRLKEDLARMTFGE